MLNFIKRLFTGDAQSTDTTASPGSAQAERKAREEAALRAMGEAGRKAKEEAERRAKERGAGR